jgi:hypothetical protein
MVAAREVVRVEEEYLAKVVVEEKALGLEAAEGVVLVRAMMEEVT